MEHSKWFILQNFPILLANANANKGELKFIFTYRSLYTWNEPPSSKRIFANSTTFINGTSTSSSKLSFTSNLYFFFFIMNAIPAPGPINVIKRICWARERAHTHALRHTLSAGWTQPKLLRSATNSMSMSFAEIFLIRFLRPTDELPKLDKGLHLIRS